MHALGTVAGLALVVTITAGTAEAQLELTITGGLGFGPDYADAGDGGADFDFRSGEPYLEFRGVADNGLSFGARVDLDVIDTDAPGVEEASALEAAAQFLLAPGNGRFAIEGSLAIDDADPGTGFDLDMHITGLNLSYGFGDWRLTAGAPQPAIDYFTSVQPTVRNEALLSGGFGLYFGSQAAQRIRFAEGLVPGAGAFGSFGGFTLGASVHHFTDFDETIWTAGLNYSTDSLSASLGFEGGDGFDEPTLRVTVNAIPNDRVNLLAHGWREAGFGGDFIGHYVQGSYRFTPRLIGGLSFLGESTLAGDRSGYGALIHYDVLQPGGTRDSLPDARAGVTASYAAFEDERIVGLGLRFSY